VFFRHKSTSKTTSNKSVSKNKTPSKEQSLKPRNIKQVKKMTSKVKGAKSLFDPNRFEFTPSPKRESKVSRTENRNNISWSIKRFSELHFMWL
jgi:hypothetical protein